MAFIILSSILKIKQGCRWTPCLMTLIYQKLNNLILAYKARGNRAEL
jgi:hypothetical protein